MLIVSLTICDISLKYAVAIGRVKDACFHLNLVRDKLLPPVEPNETSYPDIYLSLWVDMLEVVTYFNGITDESFKIHPNGSQSIEVVQIYPDVVLVKYATRILEIANLRLLIHNGCSLELCQKVRSVCILCTKATGLLAIVV